MEVVFIDRSTNRPYVASFEIKDGWHKVRKIYSLHKMTDGDVQIGDPVELPQPTLETQALNAIFLQTKGEL
jgi:hypothetical protein